MIYKEFSFGGKQNPLGSFGSILAIIVFLFLFSFLVSGVFKVLSWAAPVLIILAAIFDHTVFIDYAKFIAKLLKENLLMGIVAIVLTVVGFPAVAGYLFFKAYARKKLKDIQKTQAPKYSEYEEVQPTNKNSNPTVEEDFDPDFFKLENLEKPKIDKPNSDDKYNDLFK